MPSNYTYKNGKDKNGNQRYKLNDKSFLFNIDTLYYTVDVLNYDEVMSSGFLNTLQDGIDFMYENDEQYQSIVLNPPNCGDFQSYEHGIGFTIMSGQRPFYQYSIRSQDMAFYFMKKKRNYFKEDSKDQTFPIKVQINQHILWTKGHLKAYAESLYFLAELGFVLGQAKPNRIDLCCHSDQWNFNYYDFQSFVYPLSVTKDNHPHFMRLNPHDHNFETVYFGDRSRVQLRIYNKTIEVLKKQKLFFQEIYDSNGLVSTKDNPVWNIEFEVHRDYLKDIGDPLNAVKGFYDDMDNLLSDIGLNLLWTELTNKFNFKNAFWDRVQKGDKEKFSKTKMETYRVKDINDDVMREVAQIRGRMMKLVLTKESHSEDEKLQALTELLELIPKYEKDKGKDFNNQLNTKRLAYQDNLINGLFREKEMSIINKNVNVYVNEQKNTLQPAKVKG
jgi:hypothetical protein